MSSTALTSLSCVRLLAAAILSLCLFPAAASPASNDAAVALHMLDYMGVDYPPTVDDGAVINSAEYAEMREFAQRLQSLIRALPAQPERAELLQQARALSQRVENKVPGPEVADMTRQMRQQLAAAYGVATSPRQAPAMAGAEALYQEHCASCHGAEGHGDGPLAGGMEPAPINFHDVERARERSVYGLYSAITLGVDGTSMRGFSELTTEQRWQMAFYVSNFMFDAATRSAGAALWKHSSAAPISELNQVTQLSPAQAQQQYHQRGLALLAYLRANPQFAARGGNSPLDVARERLEESAAFYRQGQADVAYERALSAYLDGFELAESGLRAVAPELVTHIEEEMLIYRNSVRSGAPVADIEQQQQALDALLGEAVTRQSSATLTPTTGFISAGVILLREGLEAILILAAVGGVLIKTGRRDALPYLHAGWIGALALGVATWGLSSYVIEISGAGRELTEGLTALLAAAVLLYVGFWLHGKSHAKRWEQFVRERIHKALHGRALWLLTLIAFLAVYREVFETVLFYQALWLQAGPQISSALWTGALSAAAALVLLAWIILRSSLRLPLRLFFNVNAAIMLVLAVAFAGHGVAALQEAGTLPADPVAFPRIGLLGIYPTLESLAVQATLVLLVALIFFYERRRDQMLESQ